MKKHLFLSILGLIAIAGTVMAQQDMQQKAPNERTKETLLKIQAELGITNDQLAKAYPIFEKFYTDRQESVREMRAAGTMSREAVKEAHTKLANVRDEQLASVFTEQQMKSWKEKKDAIILKKKAGDAEKE